MAKKLRQMITSHMITEQASFLLTFANQQLLELTITKKCFLILDIIQKQILSNTIHILMSTGGILITLVTLKEKEGFRLGKVLLEMKNITKTFPGVKELDYVNL